MNDLLNRIREELKHSTDEKTIASSQHFFKESIKPYGVKVPLVNKIADKYFDEAYSGGRDILFSLCEELWRSGYLEETFIACSWSYGVCKEYIPSDFYIFEHWIKEYVDNWASCDTLCNHTVGEFVIMYPEYSEKLKEFAKSENRWLRRASAVTFIIPARKGLFRKDIFEIADILLTDYDDLVQKGYGWMLKAASQSKCSDVFDYVMKNKDVMPRTALRYAIEKMPPEQRAEAMKK